MYKIVRLLCLTVLMTMMFAWATSDASAALVRCRTDPIFVLSNGDSISVILDIGTTPASIKNINYVLHVPAGVTVRKVAYTNMNFRLPETYRVYQDSPAKTYTIDTIVTTQTLSSNEVIVYARMNTGITKSVSGFTNQHLFITLTRP